MLPTRLVDGLPRCVVSWLRPSLPRSDSGPLSLSATAGSKHCIVSLAESAHCGSRRSAHLLYCTSQWGTFSIRHPFVHCSSDWGVLTGKVEGGGGVGRGSAEQNSHCCHDWQESCSTQTPRLEKAKGSPGPGRHVVLVGGWVCRWGVAAWRVKINCT